MKLYGRNNAVENLGWTQGSKAATEPREGFGVRRIPALLFRPFEASLACVKAQRRKSAHYKRFATWGSAQAPRSLGARWTIAVQSKRAMFSFLHSSLSGWLAFALAIFSCSVLMSQTGSLAASAVKQPNIVFILADDLGYAELGCYGQQKIQTPNIDRLAAEGMRFTQCYSGCHGCAPSRSTLMTGLHTGHTPIRENGGYYQFYYADANPPRGLEKAGFAPSRIWEGGVGGGENFRVSF